MNEFESSLLESAMLPTLPTVAQRLLELLNGEDPSLEELADVIAIDASLSAKVMGLINSPLYGIAREITSLRQAVVYLGLRTVQSVALSFTLISTLRAPGKDAGKLDDLWLSSLMTALAARRLCAESGADWDPEEAFLTGLIEKCGALLMFGRVPTYPALLARYLAGEKPLIDLEREELETDHGRIGVLLLEKWRFSPRIVEAVRGRFASTEPRDGESPVEPGRVLLAASLLARSLSVPGFASESITLEHRLSELLSVPSPVIATLASELPPELRHTAEVFDIPAGQQRSYEELLSEANERLAGLAIDATRSAHELAENIAQTSRAFEGTPGDDASLERDPGTGLLSRGGIERLIEMFHQRARQLHRSIGILVIGVDDAKQIAREHGPAAGDAVLARVADRVKMLVRSSDPQGRLGESEVAVVTPGCTRADLLGVAQRILMGMEGTPIETPDGPLRLQLAIGMACSVPHHDGIDPRTLISFASTGLDQARVGPEPVAYGN